MVFTLCQRRRLCRVLIFIGIVCAIFLGFQLFSMQIIERIGNPDDENVQMNFQKKKREPDLGDPVAFGNVEKKSCQASNCSEEMKHLNGFPVKNIDEEIANQLKLGKGKNIDRTRQISNRERFHDDGASLFSAQREDVWQMLESYSGNSVVKNRNENPKWTDIDVARYYVGVNSKWKDYYLPDSNGQFVCIVSKEKIPATNVNDNYCDCSDSSDEPGTSACPDSRFYCKFQSTLQKSRWLPSSRVNDGLCDCCDVSDEWAMATLPGHIAHNDSLEHYGLYQAPCIDHCQELRQKEEEIIALRSRGLAKKKKYIEMAKNQPNLDQLYGSKGEFYKLSLPPCQSLTISKYTYSICPFGPASQTDPGHQPLTIGRNPKWRKRGPEHFQLLLENGDSSNCPEGKPRSTYINFICDIEDRVANLYESERCTYTVDFSTPAAC